MSKYKKLVSNSIILTIGSFGSKLITFFMVPLYTNILSTQEYGVVDLIVTTKNLLLPIVTLELGQAALRFSIDAKTKKKQENIFSNITRHGLLVLVLTILVIPFLLHLEVFGGFTGYFMAIFILGAFNTMYSQFIRGIGFIKEFAINGIIMTLVTVISNLIFLIVFDLGISGYLLSLALSYLISNIYLVYSYLRKIKVLQYRTDSSLLKDMLRFSIPIIPNSTIWWIINGSTRYFILFFIDASANGLFAVANKIPSIISLITGIFSQAWQLSSFEEYESKDKSTFYSNVFNIYSVLLFITASIILVILKPVMKIYVNAEFFLSWEIVPFLLIGVVYQSFSAFLGTNYTASKETKGTFTTSIYGGIFSLATNFILIPVFGVIGGGVSAAVSFIGMFLIRFIDTKKFVYIKIDLVNFIFNNLILLVQIWLLFVFDDNLLFVLEVLMITGMIIINRKIILQLIKTFFTKKT